MDTPDINQALQSWGNVFKTNMETCIPKGVLPRHMNLPWLSKNLKRAMQIGKYFIPKGKKSGLTELGKNIKACMHNKVTSILRNSKQAFLSRNRD